MAHTRLFLASFLVAGCGSSGAATPPPSGTIAGAPFTPTSIAAYFVAPVSCTIPTLGAITASTFLISFSSSSTACADLADFCSARKSARSVFLSFDSAGVGAMNVATIAPGTYPLAPDISVASATTVRPGVLALTFARSVITDAACTDSGTAFGSGTVVVTRADQTGIQGSIDASFSGGDRFSGNFSVPLCGPFPVDLCAELTSAFGGTPLCGSGATCH